jgi:hypothetical protein
VDSEEGEAFLFVNWSKWADMLEFMDYVQHAFYNASHWSFENSYSQLTATARGKQVGVPSSDSLLTLQGSLNSIHLEVYG